MVMPTLGADGPEGRSRIVPVKMSEAEKQAAIDVLEPQETLSAFIRDATQREVARRREAAMKRWQKYKKKLPRK